MRPMLREYTESSKMHDNVVLWQKRADSWVGASMYCEGRSYELAPATRDGLAREHMGAKHWATSAQETPQEQRPTTVEILNTPLFSLAKDHFVKDPYRYDLPHSSPFWSKHIMLHSLKCIHSELLFAAYSHRRKWHTNRTMMAPVKRRL